MTKQDFVSEVARRSGLTNKDAGKAVDAFLETAGTRASLVGRGACVEQYGTGQAFLPVLDESFPGLSPRYRQAYRSSGAPRAYAAALAARIKSLQQRFGFPVNRGMVDRYRPRRTALQAELDL